MKTLSIIAVKILKDMKNPLVIFETNEGPIFRPFKLALIDLHNSARCGIITKKAFGDGRNVPSALMQEFEQELKMLRGNELEGDILNQKAGDKYIITEGHPALTNKDHKNYGVKVGDFLIAEKGGLRVTGFLEFPFSMEERLINKTANATALNFSAKFGFSNIMEVEPEVLGTGTPVDHAEETDFEEIDEPVSNKTADEAFGKEAKATK